jgi:hypothetical protein
MILAAMGVAAIPLALFQSWAFGVWEEWFQNIHPFIK